MSFVKGQKVICVDASGSDYLKQGYVYTVNSNRTSSIELTEITALLYCKNLYYKYRFKTIIQSFNDVIPGMKLTHKKLGVVVVENVVDNRVYCDKVKSCISNIEMFEEYKPKHEKTEKTEKCEENIENKKYEVIKMFSINDLWFAFKDKWSCPEFQKEWGDFLKEFYHTSYSCYNLHFKWKSIDDIFNFRVLKRNINSLKEKGFIREVKEDTVIKHGMRLLNKDSNFKYTVVKTGYEFKDFSIIGDGREDNNFIPYIYSYGKIFKSGMTLDEFNKEEQSSFEVIDNE